MLLGPDNDVVDGDVDELDKEPDEPHEAKPYGCGDGDLRKFFPVRLGINIALFMNLCSVNPPVGLGAPLHQSDGVLAELLQRLDLLGNLVHGLLSRIYLQKELTRNC